MTSPRPKNCGPAPPKAQNGRGRIWGETAADRFRAMGRLCRCCRRRSRGRPRGPPKGSPKNPPGGPSRGAPKGQRQPRARCPAPAQPPCPPMTSPPTSAVPAYVIWPPPALVTLGGPRVALLGEGRPHIRCG